jgi:DNA-directed RNA polymerase
VITQVELEERMYQQGRDRAALLFATAEEKGRAAESPYAQRLFRLFVLPLAQLLHQEIIVEAGKARKRAAHANLLVDLDMQAVAFLAVRTTLNRLLSGQQDHHRKLAYTLGKSVHNELVLAQIELSNPELYHVLARDFHRRQSRDERHRMTVFQLEAKKAGVTWAEWSIGSRDQVGMYLLGKLSDVGLIEIAEPVVTRKHGRAHTEYREVMLAPEVLLEIDAVKGFVAETSPLFGPCVEPPLPWQGLTGGGFHTPLLRKAHRHLVKAAPVARPKLAEAAQATSPWVQAVNALQGTAWAVNGRVLAVLDDLAGRNLPVAGVTLPVDPPKPDRPPFLDVVPADQRTPDQVEVFHTWKRAMREWYEARKLRISSYARFYTTTRQARQFLGRPLWFVYFLDSRGRAYPMSTGLSPQGDDLQKGLLHFHKGLPLDTVEARAWFMIQGANKFGFDKAKLADRVKWSGQHHAEIMACAADPVHERWWADADCPLQFLAWCFEYADLQTGASTVSHLPISMDGSCNGLQHFSAMLRDEVGGEATNLTDNAEMQDIYTRVAEAAYARLRAAKPDGEGAHAWWVAKGIERDVVKRSVMTTPYGVTKNTATKYVVSDYLAKQLPDKPGAWHRAAAALVMEHIWAAIGDIVIKSRQAMDWLYKSAGALVKSAGPDGFLTWTTPDGFPATQAYFDTEITRIWTRLHGEVRIRVAVETEEPARSKHQTAMAPNFVHSMDATHMRRICLAAQAEGITDLAMIHDDYGTHAANAASLFRIIREEFLRMYVEHDPLADLVTMYPQLTPPPKPGTLDLSEVLKSEFAFS